MSTHKYMDKICCLALLLALVVTGVFLNAPSLGIQAASTTQGYESRLFDTSRVHTIDIVMDDWEGFLEGCTDEEYELCSVVIDNESYNNVAIRAKGNTSLTQVASYGNDRYSFKIEFDHYDSTISYHGLDMKLEMKGENQSALNREYGVLLAASAAVLLAGLILAWRYRKRA